MATKTWTGNQDSDYGNALNWDSGLPGLSDTAAFDSSGKTMIVTNTTEDGARAWIFSGGDYTNTISGSGVPLFFSFNGAGVQVNAGSATIRVINQGRIGFFGHADGGSAAYVIATNGILHFEPTIGPNGDNKVHVGSIEGDSTASILLAAGQQLFVGSNNLDTNYAGSIVPAATTAGSIVKVGTGTLTLSGTTDQLQSLTIAGGTVALAGSAAQNIGEIDFAPPGGVMRQAALGLADTSLGHHPVTHAGVATDDDDGTILGQLTAVLDIEGGVNHPPTIRFFGRGDGIDIATLPFAPGATAKYTGGSAHKIAVTSGGTTLTFDNVVQPGLTHFAALSDDNGGTLLVPAIVESRPNQLVDAKHHPPHQHSPGSTPDVIVASGADDKISGLRGNDILVARAPGVSMFGGPGADFFVFDVPKTSPKSHPDVIMDFHHTQGDMIDLYGLFHATHGQPLVFMHGSFIDYNHAHPDVFGMVRYAGGELQVNLDHHLKTEFVVMVHGAVHPGDLIL